MDSTHSVHEAWHPQTRHEREEVLRELEAILASPHFCNSKRYPALLRYIVENALAGKADQLKERTLGVEIFDRPADYDTSSDTVVRYTAGEVRKRLLLYYSDQPHPSSIRISLPAGSYIPEFFHAHADSLEAASDTSVHPVLAPHSNLWPHTGRGREEDESIPSRSFEEAPGSIPSERASQGARWSKRLLWTVLITLLLTAVAAGIWWKHRTTAPTVPVSEVDDFWAPVLHGQRNVVICTGSVVFTSKKNYSGVITADRDIDYPFVTWQSALAIAQVSGELSRFDTVAQLASAPSTPLTDLREHTVVLLGAYNNQWTMHLQQPLRFQFLPGDDQVIVDRLHPQVKWMRDQSQPYSSADDYAVLARFRHPTIDGWVVILAGLGRNGTEAAAQFVTSARYLQLLRSRTGSGFAHRNIEVVLKVNVIDGKTGAPSILAVHTW